jgi:hypothetical protein
MTMLQLTCRSLCSFYEDDSSPTLLTHRTFPKMKLKLKGQCFDNTEEIQTESQDVMKKLMRNDFQQCFRSWKSRCNQCINAEGDYFEGDEVNRNFIKWLKLWHRNFGNFWVAHHMFPLHSAVRFPLLLAEGNVSCLDGVCR